MYGLEWKLESKLKRPVCRLDLSTPALKRKYFIKVCYIMLSGLKYLYDKINGGV